VVEIKKGFLDTKIQNNITLNINKQREQQRIKNKKTMKQIIEKQRFSALPPKVWR
jgi:hypothetical protein